MPPKPAERAKSSKLKEVLHNQKSDKSAKERVTKKPLSTEFPRSYRLDPDVMNILKETLQRLNDESHKKISEARLIKALIYLSRDIDDQAIMQALKEVW
jgi:hypothetical protein